jgi:hypothetical protein
MVVLFQTGTQLDMVVLFRNGGSSSVVVVFRHSAHSGHWRTFCEDFNKKGLIECVTLVAQRCFLERSIDYRV